MGENEKPQEEGKAEKDLVFYYSREHRLSRAPASVRALNDENYARPTLGKRLFGNKGNVIILISIVMICAMFTFTSRFSSRGTSVNLGANTLNLTVIHEEEALGLSIKKTLPKSGEFYIGAVDIAVSPFIPQLEEGETLPVFGHRVYFNPTGTESFFMALPFDGNDFYVFLSTDYEQKVVRVR